LLAPLSLRLPPPPTSPLFPYTTLFRSLLVEHLARPLRPPEVEPGEHREHNGAEDHVVEVRDHEVGIRYLLIKGGTGQDHTGEPTEEERGQESDRPHDERLEGDRAVPHRADPVEELHTGRNRDEHRHECEERQG